MTSIDVLTTREGGSWMKVLERCVTYDFYHLPQYHVLAEEAGEGEAQMFFYTEGDYAIALPLLLRTVEGARFSEPAGTCWRDATSVYGYAGPLCSHPDIPNAVARNFRSALQERLLELRVVAVFSRLHPLFSQHALLTGIGECRVLAHTVSIDLTLTPEVQHSRFRKNHKEGINRLRRLGMSCMHDRDGQYLEDFIRIYHQTMRTGRGEGNVLLLPCVLRAVQRSP